MDYLTRIASYGRRLLRMIGLFATRTVPWSTFTRALRPDQVAVPARGRGMVFCDRETERMAFGEEGAR